MNGGNIVCEYDASNVCFNEEIFISYDNAFRMKFELQEASMNNSYIIPLEYYVESVDSNALIAQKGHADIPLMNSQVTYIQSNIYESLELGKPPPSLLSCDYVAFVIKSHFNDPP